MKSEVLLIDTISPLRAEKGLICPLPAMAQMTGILEREGIPFDIVFAIPQDDGSIDTIDGSDIITNNFESLLLEIAPRVVLFYHDPELIHYVTPVYKKTRTALPKAALCLSSSLARVRPVYFQEQGIDYVCGSSGQDVLDSFPQLAREVIAGQAPPRGKIYSAPRNYLDLNDYPLISQRYFNKITPQWCFPNGDVVKFGIIFGSIGCTGACGHCPNSAYWGTSWIPMSAERIFKEMQAQREHFGLKTFYFGDLNFFPNNPVIQDTNGVHPYAAERMRRLDELLAAYAPDVRFISTVRPDTLSILARHYPDLLERYLRYYHSCFLGFESYSPKVLAGLDRRITREMLQLAIKVLEDRNITIVASFLVGSIWETPETLAQTEAFIMEELPSSAIPLLNIMTPFPGTKFYDYIEQHNLLLEHDLIRFNGQHMLYRHPAFQPGELEERIQHFYYKFFTERYTG